MKRPAFTSAFACLLFLVPFGRPALAENLESIPDGYRLLVEETFDDAGSLSRFSVSDPSAWKWVGNESNGAMELEKQSDYRPKFRSPFNIAVLKDKVFGDFILEVDLMQTGRVYGHQDMCLFFGVKDPEHFYYAHIAVATDDHAHNVFIVNEAPRIKISSKTTPGVTWGTMEWHRVRIERTVATGMIKVYYDDMQSPIMEATNDQFKTGRIGFGSFDDVGRVDNLRIWGPEFKTDSETLFPTK